MEVAEDATEVAEDADRHGGAKTRRDVTRAAPAFGRPMIECHGLQNASPHD